MEQENKIELLWTELSSMKSIDDRRKIISKDIKSNSRKYQILAEQAPYKLFELLGGDESKIVKKNCAFEYTYEDYIEEYDLEYDEQEDDEWDLDEKSIEHAHETGHWYVTGICILKGPENITLPFEFEYCEGYLDRIIGTPYNKSKLGKHGIIFN